LNQNKIEHSTIDPYNNKRDKNKFSGNIVHLTIAKKLILSYLPIIIITSGIFTIVGIQLISTRILAETQDKVQHDLNSAREIYQGQMNRVNDVIRFTASQSFLKDALLSHNMVDTYNELIKVKVSENLDILSLTDANGVVIFRSNNPDLPPSNTKYYDELVAAVISQGKPAISTMIISNEELQREAPHLAELSQITIIDTPRSRPLSEPELKSGLMIKAAAPVIDNQNKLLGVLFGGILLNQNYEIVDIIKQTVFEDIQYNGKDIGTVTIFQDDVRISTNVNNEDGSRAIGTRVSEEVYNQVVLKGKPWIGRAYVVNDWYISAYEPINNIHYQVIGMLYVGILEQKYSDIKSQMVLVFLSIALLGIAISSLISYYFSRKITVPINNLVKASRSIAEGNLSQSLEVTSNDELSELASSFNIMAEKLIEREIRLKEFKSKVIESEKLAIIGQLAANVAHELNNPLVGIITYSHLLLEETPSSDNSTDFLQKIVIQANRCKNIVRGLLDFARQREPDRTLYNINNLLEQCVSLLKNQALFQNIKINQNLDDLPMIIIDPSQFERVIMNIMLNAAEAITGNGELNISSKYEPEENSIVIDFNDTGSGISEENLENIFEPFFSTKDAGHGVGLGLAICYGIIQEHNGTVNVKSRLGEGTTFTIKLPVSFRRNTRYH